MNEKYNGLRFILISLVITSVLFASDKTGMTLFEKLIGILVSGALIFH